VSGIPAGNAVSLIVPNKELKRAAGILHREFFGRVDPSVFVESPDQPFQKPEPFSSFVESTDRASRLATNRRPHPLRVVSQN